MNPFNFIKMHSLGNDFVVIDGLSQSIDVSKLPIEQLAHRHLGIGFDQLLWIKSSSLADFACIIFNADGSEAEQCGNGMRCIARYLHEEKLTLKKTLSLETKAGIIEIQIYDYNRIEVNMGFPRFEPHEIPFNTDEIQNQYELVLEDNNLNVAVSILSMGNPHAIVKVDSTQHFPVANIGPLIATHSLFPQGTNVGFMEVLKRNHIRLRTFERGSGETLACGSNACAAVVAGILNNSLDSQVKVEFMLGDLWVNWKGKNHPVMMMGPASRVFSGKVG